MQVTRQPPVQENVIKKKSIIESQTSMDIYNSTDIISYNKGTSMVMWSAIQTGGFPPGTRCQRA